jgi:hypothetical protein
MSQEPEEVDIVPTNIEAFINAFHSIGGGIFADDTAEHMRDCVKATMMHEKKSQLTIVLDIEKIADDQIAITGAVRSKKPESKPKAGFFVNDMTFLPSRERPKQQTLPGVR